MEWSIVSKAAESSSKTEAVGSPLARDSGPHFLSGAEPFRLSDLSYQDYEHEGVHKKQFYHHSFHNLQYKMETSDRPLIVKVINRQ